MKAVNMLALVLVVIGGLNWGLVGFFDYNLVTSLFGDASGLSRTIFALVGLSALWVAFTGFMPKAGLAESSAK